MMVKNVPSLNVRSALLYPRYILVIGIRLAIFALTVAIHFIFGKNEKRSLSINATMISVHILKLLRPNSILPKGS